VRVFGAQGIGLLATLHSQFFPVELRCLFGFLEQQIHLSLRIAGLTLALEVIHVEDELSVVDRLVALPGILVHLKSL